MRALDVYVSVEPRTKVGMTDSHCTVASSSRNGPGMATVDAWASTGDTNTTYYHTGILGSTRGTSVSGGTGIFNASWKAFGEKVVGTVGRYGYAGAWGYQAHEDLGALHVGARYYDPAIGRFLQRDSIGILGGKNVYAYVANAPTVLVDPDGLVWAWVIRGGEEGHCASRQKSRKKSYVLCDSDRPSDRASETHATTTEPHLSTQAAPATSYSAQASADIAA